VLLPKERLTLEPPSIVKVLRETFSHNRIIQYFNRSANLFSV